MTRAKTTPPKSCDKKKRRTVSKKLNLSSPSDSNDAKLARTSKKCLCPQNWPQGKGGSRRTEKGGDII